MARFLALLELYRDGVVTLHQDEPMAELAVRRLEDGGDLGDPAGPADPGGRDAATGEGGA